MRALLGRLMAPAKAETLPAFFALPESRLTDQAHAEMQAVSSVAIVSSAAGELLTALAQVVKILEADDLLKRVERIEGMTS